MTEGPCLAWRKKRSRLKVKIKNKKDRYKKPVEVPCVSHPDN
jgi:hypothetical protein